MGDRGWGGGGCLSVCMQNRDGHGVDHGHNHMLATISRTLN